ncbi:MAG: carbohydrate ABC transporter permease [Dehalococcoidia bacterium]
MANIESFAPVATLSRGAVARRRYWRTTALAYAFLAPALLIIGLFHLFPVAFAFYISLWKWGVLPERFVGFGNYALLLQDDDFKSALVHTVWFAVLTVPAGLTFALFVALLLNRRLKGLAFFRASYFIPYVTSSVAAATVWRFIFSDKGLASSLWQFLGLSTPKWIDEPKGIFQMAALQLGQHIPTWAYGPSLAMVCIAVMSIWYAQGFDMIVFLAGLTSIPRDLYEAGRIDGGGEWQLFRHITWPMLLPTTFFLLIISTIRSFQAFNQIYIMTAGGPVNTTTVTTLLLYNTAFRYGKAGYGTSMAFVLFAVILALTLVQTRLLASRVEETRG